MHIYEIKQIKKSLSVFVLKSPLVCYVKLFLNFELRAVACNIYIGLSINEHLMKAAVKIIR